MIGWSHYVHARESHSKTGISSTTGSGKTSAMWANSHGYRDGLKTSHGNNMPCRTRNKQ